MATQILQSTEVAPPGFSKYAAPGTDTPVPNPTNKEEGDVEVAVQQIRSYAPSALRPARDQGLVSAVVAQIIGQGGLGSPLPVLTPKTSDVVSLTAEDEATVARLKARDKEVRALEAAHVAADRAVGARPQYRYQWGPDGMQYAVSGSIPVDTPFVPSNPEATLRRLEDARRAALAPNHPSSEDRAAAVAAELAARAALAALESQQNSNNGSPSIAEAADLFNKVAELKLTSDGALNLHSARSIEHLV